jgi:hypothetical protein
MVVSTEIKKEAWINKRIINKIIRLFIFILIVMSIGRIGVVFFHEVISSVYPSNQQIAIEEKFSIDVDDKSKIILNKNISDKLKNSSYYARYGGVDKNDLSFNLTKDEESFLDIANAGNPNEGAQNYISNIGNKAIEGQIQVLNNPISISRSLTSEQRNSYSLNYFNNISLNFIRSELGRILFLIILINIYFLVPKLTGVEDKSIGIEENKDKRRLSDLILTSLILALILTLTPEGEIGTITLNISPGGAISAFLLIISFILVYLFREGLLENLLRRK